MGSPPRRRPPAPSTALGAGGRRAGRAGRAALVGLGLSVLGVAGCASPAEEARDDATAAVRSKAEELRSDLAGAAAGSSGAAQLEAVRAVLPDLPLTAAADGDGVVVTGAMTEASQTGGGLSYERWTARLCLEYRVAPGSGETTVTDAECPADVETLAPADATVRLDD